MGEIPGTDVLKTIISNHLRATSSVTLRRAQRAAEEITRRYGPIKLTPQQRAAERRQQRAEHVRNLKAEALRRKRQRIQDRQYERNQQRVRRANAQKAARLEAQQVARENVAIIKVRTVLQPLGSATANRVLHAVVPLFFTDKR